ncbi:MAG: hypothetical protein J6K17_15130 [Oscillospiraceae bacterium]|nr:hypothetical protein [Oscillospiraceae bacterium]
MKKKLFLQIAKELNEVLGITPLLFGSLGLEQRLGANLNADDIDVLIPEEYLDEKWDMLIEVMTTLGYSLYDVHEHAFKKDGVSAAFASIENLVPFAGVNITRIPVVDENGVRYYLLGLEDYLKVYTASSKDGYRRDTKNKNDTDKIELIKRALEK